LVDAVREITLRSPFPADTKFTGFAQITEVEKPRRSGNQPGEKKWLDHDQLGTTAIYADAAGVEEKDIAGRMWDMRAGNSAKNSCSHWKQL
jgi:hypothetical protein